MNHNEITYYERRLSEERMHAVSAPCPAAKAVHAPLGELYKARLDEGRISSTASDSARVESDS